MNKKRVAVLFGGHSAEHEVSRASAHTLITHMSEEKYSIIPVYIAINGQWFLYDGALDNMNSIPIDKFGISAVISPDRTHKCLLRMVGSKVKRIPVDIVFPVLHGANGEDGAVQGLFELAGIPYVGCGVLSSALCMDKSFTKLIASTLSLTQASHFTFAKQDLNDMEGVAKKIRYRIGYPCFVKPANTGSSVGISKVKNKKELIAALLLAAKHDRKIIVEKAVNGRELECAVLGAGGDDAEVSVVGEVVPAAEFYDYDAKYNNVHSKTIVPANIPDNISNEIRDIAKKIFKATDCSGLARVDFFLEQNTNKVFFNEINTMPGFTAISMYPKLWKEMGVSTSDLIDRLIDIGWSREC